jgi:hypothetical protein
MSRPKPGPVYVVRWTRRGGTRVHRFYFKRWYALRLAMTLDGLGYDVEVYTSTTAWTKVTLPNYQRW